MSRRRAVRARRSQLAAGGSGAQLTHVQFVVGIGCVPNSSNNASGCVNGCAPNIGLDNPSVGISKPLISAEASVVETNASASAANAAFNATSDFFMAKLDACAPPLGRWRASPNARLHAHGEKFMD